MKKQKKSLLAFLLALFVLFSGFSISQPSSVCAQDGGGVMAVHFLDVGQGLSILVQSGGQNLIYDGGGKGFSSYVVSYLANQQIETIDYLIASHYDQDHINGLIGCFHSFDVKHVIGPDYVHSSDLYSTFMDCVAQEGTNVDSPAVGTTYPFGTGSFTVLAPAQTSNDSNDNSVVIRLENGENHFLFTGDAEHGSEAAMISSGLNLDCDVLSVGHHGSATSTSWDFLEATLPEYAVISCGSDNSYGHPDADTMEKLRSMEIDVFRTDVQGTVIAVSDGSEITWTQAPCNDYSSGDGEESFFIDEAPEDFAEETPTYETYEVEAPAQNVGTMVWLSATGSKYHNKPNCGNMNPANARQVSEVDALSQGYEACKKCY